MPRIIVGLPSLSRGPLLDAAVDMGAPVMVSATALARWADDGPVPAGYEFTPLEQRIRAATGDDRPPTLAQSKRRMRSWRGWNTAALDRILGTGVEVHLDSAGFVAMARFAGFPWTVESYVLGLAAHPAVTRYSSMDTCVEPEVAPDSNEVEERLARTIRLNRQVARLAQEEGIADRLMPVVQGATADQYLRCFDAISGVVRPGATIGVGSMCRRPTRGPDGSMAILERLDRELPRDVRLHLFGIKGDGAEAACAFGDRIDSVDSQSYGVRARRIADERRRTDPGFSKTNAMVAGVMRDWYLGQRRRLENPRPAPVQPEMAMSTPAARPHDVLGALERLVRHEFNGLIMDGSLDHDQIVGGRMLEESVCELVAELPDGVGAGDPWRGAWQLPARHVDEGLVPDDLLA